MRLSDAVREEILQLQLRYPTKRSALIPALHKAQGEIGYLPIEIQEEVAELFGIALSEVTAIVSFYDMFFTQPKGKHLLHVCKNVSCMLRGCDGLLESLCKKLGINPGETTADGRFTLIASECLAACDRAPMMLIDEEVVGPVVDLEKLLAEIHDE